MEEKKREGERAGIQAVEVGAKNMRKIERGDSSTRAREREDKKGIRNESKRGKKKTGEGRKKK